MLQKHQLKTLSDAVSDAWKNVNFAKMNGLERSLSEHGKLPAP